MTGGKQNGKLQKTKIRSNRSSAESPQKDDNSTSSMPDLSILRKPIQTSITGFSQARNVFDSGTEEIKQLLSTECDVIYECRVCRNLFRSLANFISHKRVYCRQKFNTSLHAHFINNKFLEDDMVTIIQNEQDYQNYLKNKDHTNSNTIPRNDMHNEMKNPLTKDLTSVIERLTAKFSKKSESNEKNGIHERIVKLQPSLNTTKAVYQNITDSTRCTQDSMKEQVKEIEQIVSSQEAVLGPDGKLVSSKVSISNSDANGIPVIHISDDEEDDSTPSNIFCKICKIKFSTQKTLRFHIKHKHAENRLVYPCPDCSEYFANPWGVYRHLFKVHRKSAANIRKLRDYIHKKAFRLERTPDNDKKKDTSQDVEIISEQHRLDLENQEWMDNLEGDCEVPRCGGCGRRFERRAALSSHRQTCQLRIAAQNKITSNMQRRVAAKTTVKEHQLVKAPDIEPPNKFPRLQETKPCEKTIEIQIRKDYNKVPLGSPLRMGSNSPLTDTNVEADSYMSIRESGAISGKGEIGDINNFNEHCNLSNIINNTIDNETVKDCDDAYVKNSDVFSVNLNADVDTIPLNSSSDISGVINKEEIDDDSSNIDDSDLSFEDIRRICHTNKDTNQEAVLSETEELDDAVLVKNENASEHKSEVKKEPTNDDTEECAIDSADLRPIIILDRKYPCVKCNMEFSSESEFIKHLDSHNNEILFKCKLCNYQYNVKSECMNHLKNQHRVAGHINRIETFVQNVPKEKVDTQKITDDDLPEKITEKGKTESLESQIFINSPDQIEHTSTQTSPVNLPESFKVESLLDSPDSSSEQSILNNSQPTSGNESISSRKRGRPKGTFKKLKRRITEEHIKLTGNHHRIKGVTVSSAERQNGSRKLIKERSISTDSSSTLEDKHKTPEKLNENIKVISQSSSVVTLASNAGSIGIMRDANNDQHTASSKSSTVKRPIRNRIKPLNKDFEYDLSNLLKREAEAYKESHLSSNVSQKSQLKRKPLLQNEITSVEPSSNFAEQKEVTSPKILSPSSNCQGALRTLSLQATKLRRAHMKQYLTVPPQRSLPSFITQRIRPPMIPPKTTSSKCSPQTTPAASPRVIKERTVPPEKTVKTNNSQPPITHLMTSEKLSSDSDVKKYQAISPIVKQTENKKTSSEEKNTILLGMSKVFSTTKSSSVSISSHKIKKKHDVLNNSVSLLLRPNNVDEIPCENTKCEKNNSETALEDASNKPGKSNIDCSESDANSNNVTTNISVLKSLKENERLTTKKVFGTTKLHESIAKHKSILNVKDLKTKLANHLSLNQAKIVSESNNKSLLKTNLEVVTEKSDEINKTLLIKSCDIDNNVDSQ